VENSRAFSTAAVGRPASGPWVEYGAGSWGVAKLVRRLTLDQEIVGSNPTAPAMASSPNSG
jgi:hypothetical protein